MKAAGPDRPAPPPSRVRAALVLAPPAAAFLLLAAAIVGGGLALESLRGQERYQIAFNDIDCTPPPGQSREAFLLDVQYYGDLPDSVCVLDDALPARLSAAFARDPWVERVEGVEVAAPRRVRVRLKYRAPALRVQAAGDVMRAVDGQGVRLPQTAVMDSLPLLVGDVQPPTGQEGRPWGDGRVQAAARTAALLRPYQDRLRLTIFEALPDSGLVLRGAGRRVLWGAAPGSEPPGEAAADAKLRRLLDCAERRAEGPWDVDVRPAP